MVQARLLDVAISEFGLKGLDGASTRGIAAAAGTAMSSITYHYGGKEGLYTAAVRHIEASMAGDMSGELAASPVADDPVADDPIVARAALHRLLDLLATKFLDGEGEQWSLLIMREQMHPTDAFDIFYDGAMGRLAERVAALVRGATRASEPAARMTAVSLFGQVVVWRVSRALADRLLGGPADDARRSAVRALIARNTDCILDRLSAEAQEPR